MYNMTEKADSIADKLVQIGSGAEASWSAVRDFCDSYTGGELDCQPLDILTDMVVKRLETQLEDS